MNQTCIQRKLTVFRLFPFLLTVSAVNLVAQQRSVVGSGGRDVIVDQVCLEYTVGEAVISPAAAPSVALSGGYQVPSLYDFWTTSNSLLGGPAGDPDGDGAKNLMEYATGTDPKSAASVSRAQVSIGPGGKIYVTLAKNPLRTDVLWTAQGSKNLVNWSTAEVSTAINNASLFSALFTGESPAFLRIGFYADGAK